ncbi:family 2 glycosyl transferase [Chondrocystis sp. NIES-4102]|nr:family 2 glycosyl transferase [Chondrocystis sp. NIES-4102]
MKNLGIVIIGRNEGERLRQCLLSVVELVDDIVYVDSGSTDDSVAMAQGNGVKVVELDLSIPFTAARARNEGFEYLLKTNPHLEFVQFVDGDCEVIASWLSKAYQEISQHSDWAVVCGRRRERKSDRSIYNLLCDIEWNTPIGEALTCGGDAMMRVAAFRQVDGFNPTLIAGEESELCLRLRRKGWKVWRIDAQMTLHDAQIIRFTQWWKRSLRSGHAYAEGAWLYGKDPERHRVKETKSIWLWGAIIPLIVIALLLPTQGWSLTLLLGYPVMIYKIYRYFQTRNFSNKNALLYATNCVLIKFPQAWGQIQFHLDRLLGRQRNIVEYKNSELV